MAYEYFDVRKDPRYMQEMLRASGGKRDVPVLVDGDEVTIGFGGT